MDSLASDSSYADAHADEAADVVLMPPPAGETSATDPYTSQIDSIIPYMVQQESLLASDT